MDNDIATQKHNLLFGVRRSVRYHNRRRMFFDRWQTVTSWISVVFGSATVITVIEANNPKLAVGMAAIVTFSSAVDLVVGTVKAARDHYDLAKRFISLEQEIISVQEMDEKSLIRLKNARLDIEKDEPPVLRVLDTLCHNEMLRSMGYDKEEFKKVGLTQRFFSPVFDFREHSIQ